MIFFDNLLGELAPSRVLADFSVGPTPRSPSSHTELGEPDDDPTGIGTLSAAYTNRGIIRDRKGRHREAYEDYVTFVQIDYEIADRPSWIKHLLYYEHEPSSALKRAQYL